MAGSPEQLTRQAASAEGEHDLKDLLGRIQTQPTDTWYHVPNFSQAESRIHFATGINIPQALMEQFWLLDALPWRIAESKMSALFIGGNFDSNRKADINQALVTIDVARRMKIVNGIEEPEPLYLRIAGLTDDKTTGDKTIFATQYDLQKGGQLTKLTISLPKDDKNILNLMGISLESLPTDMDHPYKTAGLITRGMCEAVKHDRAINFQINGNHVFLGKAIPIQLTDGENRSDAKFKSDLNNIGYFVRVENGLVRVSIKPGKASGRRLWMVSVPVSLQSATAKISI